MMSRNEENEVLDFIDALNEEAIIQNEQTDQSAHFIDQKANLAAGATNYLTLKSNFSSELSF